MDCESTIGPESCAAMHRIGPWQQAWQTRTKNERPNRTFPFLRHCPILSLPLLGAACICHGFALPPQDGLVRDVDSHWQFLSKTGRKTCHRTRCRRRTGTTRDVRTLHDSHHERLSVVRQTTGLVRTVHSKVEGQIGQTPSHSSRHHGVRFPKLRSLNYCGPAAHRTVVVRACCLHCHGLRYHHLQGLDGPGHDRSRS